jgi:hypothetical protein
MIIHGGIGKQLIINSTQTDNKQVTLTWDANKEPDVKYRLYVQHNKQAQPQTYETDQTTIEIELDGFGTYTIWVTAWNDSGESGPSRTVKVWRTK